MIHVPSEKPTIQVEIGAALGGNTVLVADGTYAGAGNLDINFLGRAITVQSEDGTENCVVDRENAGRGFYFHNNENLSSVLRGVTIFNELASGLWSENFGAVYIV